MSTTTKLHTLAHYIAAFRNWPSVSGIHFSRNGHCAHVLRLRNGHSIYLLHPQAEIRAYASIYRHHCYECDFGPLPPDGTVIDLGANVGIFSLYAATRLVPRGRVLAVEAAPTVCTKLRATLSTVHNAEIWQGAVGGSGTLWLAQDSLGASIFHDSDSTAKVESVGIAPELVLRHFPTVDLLKINMEGAEYPFLLDTDDALFRAVKRIAIKWHKGTELASGHHPDQLRDRLLALGFKIHSHRDIWSNGRLTTGITTGSLHLGM